jgi:hypothetical protein
MARPCIERVALAVALAAAGRPAAAQGPRMSQPLAAGEVVRLLFTDGSVAAGRLLVPFAADSSTFVYCPYETVFCREGANQRRVVMPASQVRQVEVRRGSQVLKGLLIGAASSAAVAGALCLAAQSLSRDCNGHDFPKFAALFVVPGAVIGGALGLSRPHWEPAP